MRIFSATLVLLIAMSTCVPVTNAATQEEVDQLRAEISLLKMKLKDAQNKASSDTDSTDTNTRPMSKPIRDITDLIKTFPRDIQPDPDTGIWSKKAESAVIERLNYSVWDTKFRDESVLESISVRENPALKDDASASPWVIYLQFKPVMTEYHGRKLKQSISKIRVFGNDALARKARNLEAGDKLRVSGDLVTIRGLYLGNTIMMPSFTIQLRNLEVEGFIRP